MSKTRCRFRTFRLPLNRFCPPDRPGRRFGIHDIERMVKGNIVFSAWENSGFWAIDISDPLSAEIRRPFRSAGFSPSELGRRSRRRRVRP